LREKGGQGINEKEREGRGKEGKGGSNRREKVGNGLCIPFKNSCR